MPPVTVTADKTANDPVFLSSAPVFSFRGEENMGGRKAVRFDYKVSLPTSGYHIRVNGSEVLSVKVIHGHCITWRGRLPTLADPRKA